MVMEVCEEVSQDFAPGVIWCLCLSIWWLVPLPAIEPALDLRRLFDIHLFPPSSDTLLLLLHCKIATQTGQWSHLLVLLILEGEIQPGEVTGTWSQFNFDALSMLVLVFWQR